MLIGIAVATALRRERHSVPCALPPDAKKPCLRSCNERRARVASGFRAVLVGSACVDLVATSERMHEEVAENVRDRACYLRWSAQDVSVVAIGEDPAFSAHQPVQPAGDPDRETLQAASQSRCVRCLDDQVKMVALHREVDEAETEPVAAACKCLGQESKAAAAAEVPYVRHHSPGHVDGVVLRQSRACDVWNAWARTMRFAARAFPLASPSPERQRQLLRFRGRHLDSAEFQKTRRIGIGQVEDRCLLLPGGRLSSLI